SGGLSRRARGGGRGNAAPAGDAAAVEAAARHRGCVRAGTHAVRVRADSRGTLPGYQRGRANRVHDALRDVVHAELDNVRPADGQHQSRPVRQAAAGGPPGAVHRAGGDVVDVLQVAVAARRVRHVAAWDAGAARGNLFAPRYRRRLRALQTGPTIVRILRTAHVHDHDRAHRVHELQVRLLAGTRV